MKLPGVVLATIETAFNKIIADQPNILNENLHYKSIQLQFEGVDLSLYFQFSTDAVFVFDHWQQSPDATIQGTPLALIAVGMSGEANTKDMKIEGDLQVTQAFERLLKAIDIDWEEILSHYTGDAVAYQFGELTRQLKKWAEQSSSSFADDLRDYLQIETRQLPLPAEVEQFNNSVDDIRAATERFEMRLQRFQSRLELQEEAP